ncbi:hypothetical protein DENSPDRAFT_581296 [Dentipellis sp. KUC8613]|nr:hypothetical protein DENSPDRAFT_581296 [Dentipellis sp. KUC8613]
MLIPESRLYVYFSSRQIEAAMSASTTPSELSACADLGFIRTDMDMSWGALWVKNSTSSARASNGDPMAHHHVDVECVPVLAHVRVERVESPVERQRASWVRGGGMIFVRVGSAGVRYCVEDCEGFREERKETDETHEPSSGELLLYERMRDGVVGVWGDRQ